MLTDFEKMGPEGPTRSNPVFSSLHRTQPPASSQRTVANLGALEEVLSFISADAPRGMGSILSQNGEPADDYWLGVIFATRREFGAEGKAVARKWSETSPRYTVEGFDSAWEAFDPDRLNPVTIGSVYSLARKNGWNGQTPLPPRPEPEPTRYKLLSRTDIMALQPMQWLVKGLLPTTGVASIFGPSSSGKSFLATDLGLCVAFGRDWFGKRTRTCPVTYLMLEGEAGLRNRLLAWEKHSGLSVPDNFRAIIQPYSFGEVADVEDLAAALPRDGLIIVDTLNRATPGLDENSGLDMGKVIAGMKRLHHVAGGLVLSVHHTGKNTERGMRGHSSLHAALDGAIEVHRASNGRSWSAAKVKDNEDGQATPFKLEIISVGFDEDGCPETSCAISPDVGAVPARKEPTGSVQKKTLSVIRRELSTSAQAGIGGCGPDIKCLSFDDAVDAVAAALTTTEVHKRRHNARNALTKLIDGDFLSSGLDENEDTWLWK